MASCLSTNFRFYITGGSDLLSGVPTNKTWVISDISELHRDDKMRHNKYGIFDRL